MSGIAELDPLVLEDSIFKTFARSPETAKYMEERVKQIVVQILAHPLIEQLKEKVDELENVLSELEEENQYINSSLKKSTKQTGLTVEKYSKLHKELQNANEKSLKLQKQRDQLTNKVTNLEKQCKQSADQVNKLQQIVKDLQVKNNKYVQEIKQLERLIVQYQKNIDKKQMKIQQEAKEKQRQKRAIKQTKYNEIKLRKQYDELSKNFNQMEAAFVKQKNEIQIEVIGRQNQRKAFHSKINELYFKAKKLGKTKKVLLHIVKQVHQMENEKQKLKNQMKLFLKQINKQIKYGSQSIMDYIGDKVNGELKYLIAELSKNTTQVKILRQQVKIKDQIIMKLQKVSEVQVMGNKQMQKELKNKKMEVDTLKQELKRNYENSEIKLMGLEHSYRQILSNSLNFP